MLRFGSSCLGTICSPVITGDGSLVQLTHQNYSSRIVSLIAVVESQSALRYYEWSLEFECHVRHYIL